MSIVLNEFHYLFCVLIVHTTSCAGDASSLISISNFFSPLLVLHSKGLLLLSVHLVMFPYIVHVVTF
jgi:hypothetical protein